MKGSRQVVGEAGAGEAFELDLEIVRASREEHVRGLLVWNIRAKGDPIEAALAASSPAGGQMP